MEDKQNRSFGIILRLTLGILFLILLIWNVSLDKLLLSISQASLFYLLLAISYQYASIFLGAFNQYILFTAFSNLPFKSYLTAYVKAYAFGLLLPSQIGDASIAFFLKSEGLYYSQTLSVYILDKFLTFILYVIVLFLFLGDIMGYPMIVSFSSIISFGLSLSIMFYIIVRLTSSFPVSWRENRLMRFVHNLSSQLFFFTKHHSFLLLINFFLTCFKLGLVMLCYHAMITSLNYSLSIWRVGQTAIASGIVGYIPVSIQGLGTVEAMALLNFKTLGVSPADVLACYLVLRSNNYVAVCLAYAATFIAKRNKSTQRNIV
ncbi:MAG: flippase-like domain-containing protein [Deltaproteobacteria bacterium]|jgi:uncharacterized membrane protein YbhN (UPF0104 family)|nr:flippase-like domain-containing protein [Deltaproteobacteria bacterium]